MKFKWFTLSMLSLALGSSLVAASWARCAPELASISGVAQEQEGWDAPPNEFREIQRQGFKDGIEGARKDFDNHRRPDVNNREEYRHPHMAPSAREDYREGFRRGYDAGVRHLYGGEPGHYN